jgi:hypothetical protein
MEMSGQSYVPTFEPQGKNPQYFPTVLTST